MAALGALDTPRTNLGDATYLSRQPDLDLSEEVSVPSPSKDANLFQQLRNGGRQSLRTPRGKRTPFGERQNRAAGGGAPEFTPLLKSATRRSVRRHSGKENVAATPAFLNKIDEDMTPLPNMDNSVFGMSRNTSSFIGRTPVPQVDSDSTVDTPMVMKTRRNAAKSPLNDKNQLSLREQENVIDRIEKENFGLKLKIHFLEDALRRAGPGFSEAALKENTELKVDSVTMKRELHRYKKHLTSAEKDLEAYRQQILEMQEKFKKRQANEGQRLEIERLQQALEEKDAGLEDLQQKLDQGEKELDRIEKLQDEIGDLEADNRAKDQLIGQHEDEIEDLKLRVQAAEDKAKDSQRRMVELEEKAQASSKLAEVKETIEDLEADVRRLQNELEESKDKLQDAVDAKDRAEGDLEELQEEMANKSVVTKGLSRQVEEKIARLQDEVEDARSNLATVNNRYQEKEHEVEDLKRKLKESRQERETFERENRSLSAEVDELQGDLRSANDHKSMLQTRHDALTKESASLQRDVSRLERDVTSLEASLEQERQHALQIERTVREQNRAEINRLRSEISDLQARAQEAEEDRQHATQSDRISRDQLRDEVERLKDDISDLQAQIREKDNMYDNDREKWETEIRNLEAERDRAEERANGLQRTIDKLRATEGALSTKEAKLQHIIDTETERHRKEEAVLSRQIESLQKTLDSRQTMLEDLRIELSAVREQLRQAQVDYQSEVDKVEGLEDELELLQVELDEQSEKASQDLEQAKRECENLRQQLKSAQESAVTSVRQSTTVSQEVARHNSEHIQRLKDQLAESTTKFSKATKEKQLLQEQLAGVNTELYSLRVSLAETQAERESLESDLRLAKQSGQDVHVVNQEIVDLRTTKTKLDSEVRRLKEENKSLAGRLMQIEAELQDAKLHGQDTALLDQERMDLLTAKSRLDGEVRRLGDQNRSLTSRLREVETELRLAKQQEDHTKQLELQRGDIISAKSRLESELRRLKEENVVLATEKAEIENELVRVSKNQGEDTLDLNFERITLRTAKNKLETELRCLKEKNRQLEESLLELERQLDEENERAAQEEERLTHEILELQAKLRQSTDTQAQTASRRKIRELERRIDDYEARLAITTNLANVDGNSDLSILRRDITSARQKERDFAEREAAHKSTVRDLKRQISDLERMVHEAEMQRLLASPADARTPSARKSELAQLRHQLTLAHQVGQDLKQALREAERDADAVKDELQARIGDLEDQAASLEQQLDDARAAAEEAASASETALIKYKGKVERYRRERDQYAAALDEMQHTDHGSALTARTDVSNEERRDLHGMLRKAQIEADSFEREVREHKALAEELSKAQETLRLKLERVRGERAVYRKEAERMRRDLRAVELNNAELIRAKDEAEGALVANALILASRDAAAIAAPASNDNKAAETVKEPEQVAERQDLTKNREVQAPAQNSDIDAKAVLEKAEKQRERHQRELRGLVTQIEWMQARWERESRFRLDAVSSKQYLQHELKVAKECNKLDLDILGEIVKTIEERQTPSHAMRKQHEIDASTPMRKLKHVLHAVRFTIRLRRSAQAWSVHLQTRQRLQDALDKVQKASRMRKMRDEWRAQVYAKLDADREAAGLPPAIRPKDATITTVLSVEF
ncbi:uncharacterized protein PgNI_00473 [Pyricularia grisea]|uniref:Uncharacterized protein n=1 Tax=Pyricularia grisea TaxID=148305 RepID=A0A6P8BLP3_PYRGI|nr:uncharacterized protein PgNI_00473 [Pyricularia grisea]TLD17560.1 hypothetical protein PgNI_00473 [Pyricularia grisea]